MRALFFVILSPTIFPTGTEVTQAGMEPDHFEAELSSSEIPHVILFKAKLYEVVDSPGTIPRPNQASVACLSDKKLRWYRGFFSF
jgi:hypothetical protein